MGWLQKNSLVNGKNEQKTSDESALEFWSFVYVGLSLSVGFPGGSSLKNLPSMQEKNLPSMQEMWFNSLVGKLSWIRKWQPTPVFLPGKSYRQRSLAGDSPQGHKSQTELSD